MWLAQLHSLISPSVLSFVPGASCCRWGFYVNFPPTPELCSTWRHFLNTYLFGTECKSSEGKNWSPKAVPTPERWTGKPADQLSPLGLKTTFIPKPWKAEQNIGLQGDWTKQIIIPFAIFFLLIMTKTLPVGSPPELLHMELLFRIWVGG